MLVRFSTSVMGLSETPLCPEKKPPGAAEAVRERQTHRLRDRGKKLIRSHLWDVIHKAESDFRSACFKLIPSPGAMGNGNKGPSSLSQPRPKYMQAFPFYLESIPYDGFLGPQSCRPMLTS